MDTKREAAVRRTFRETAALSSLLALGTAAALWLLGRDIASPVKLLRAERLDGLDVAVELDETFSSLAEEVRRSVVSIGITRESDEPAPEPGDGGDEGDGDTERERWEEESIGSDHHRSERLILTNHHLVKGSSEIHVKLHDERESRARMIQSDPSSDIALIKIDEEGLRPIRIGDSDDARVGQWVLAVGNPFGLTQTVSAGIVSALHRSDLRILPFESFDRDGMRPSTRGTAAGRSCDIRGEAIGINTAMYSNSAGGNQGIGFAIPINLAKTLVDRWIEGKSASSSASCPRAWIPTWLATTGSKLPAEPSCRAWTRTARPRRRGSGPRT